MAGSGRCRGGWQERAQALRVVWRRCERQGVEWQGVRNAAVVVVECKDEDEAARERERRYARVVRGAVWYRAVLKRASNKLNAKIVVKIAVLVIRCLVVGKVG